MLQPLLLQLSALSVNECYLLKLGVKIYSYNDHRSAPFSRALLVGQHHQLYLGLGADIVMESISQVTGWARVVSQTGALTVCTLCSSAVRYNVAMYQRPTAPAFPQPCTDSQFAERSISKMPFVARPCS